MARPDEYPSPPLVGEPLSGPTDPAEPALDASPSLLEGATDLLQQWDHTQSKFVDEPRIAVQEASELVEDVLGRLARTFDDERGRLEATWTAGREPSTEELRQCLQRYRAFFERLLSA